MTRCRKVVLACVAVAMPYLAGFACGPDWGADVFVRPLRPDDSKSYLNGKLGVLQPTYPRADLIFAYRILNGGALSEKEKSSYVATESFTEIDLGAMREGQNVAPVDSKGVPQPPKLTPEQAWLKARAAYPGSVSEINPDRVTYVRVPGNFEYHETFTNCYDDAFRKAASTLHAREAAWGAQSEWTMDWVRAQDVVFRTCAGTESGVGYQRSPPLPIAPPAGAPAGAPALLLADRAYQIAAALFYAQNYDAAHAAFLAIAKNSASPWQPWGQYLAARALVRKSFNTPETGDPLEEERFDGPVMEQAQREIEAALSVSPKGEIRDALEAQLEFVTLRTEPEKRASYLGASLAGPRSDPGFAQHLIDLTWLMDFRSDGTGLRSAPAIGEFTRLRPYNDHKVRSATELDKAFTNQAILRATSDLVDWLFTFQSGSRAAKTHATDTWTKTHSMPWLLNALAHCEGTETEDDALLAAASKVDPSSPAWASVTFHLVRLLQIRGEWEGAAAALRAGAPAIESNTGSTQNAFLQLQMMNAGSLEELLEYAPKRALEKQSQDYYNWQLCSDLIKKEHRRNDCQASIDEFQYDGGAAAVLNTQLPMAMLVSAAKSSLLSEQLHQALVIMAWTRAIRLKDTPHESALRPMLPIKLLEEAGLGERYSLLLTLARNPGLVPYLGDGVQRSYAYDFVDSYRDNWGPWDGVPIDGPAPRFLSAKQRAAASYELRVLQASDAGSVPELAIGRELVDYVRDHGDVQQGDEAMFLVLRMLRYGGLGWSDSDEVRKKQADLESSLRADAARILRQRYASSQWTQKAGPFVR